jgi:hypothetical protein
MCVFTIVDYIFSTHFKTNSATKATETMSSLRISANLLTSAPQNVRPVVPTIRQQRNASAVTAKAAYDGAPGMREIDPQGRAGQTSSMSASTSSPVVSYRVSLFGKYIVLVTACY